MSQPCGPSRPVCYMILLAAVVAACGGTGQAPEGETSGGGSGFTLSGSLTGLALGDAVKLQLNGANDITLTANGAFTFAAPITLGAPYAVTVFTPPAAGSCTVLNGAGLMPGAPVNDVVVSCNTTTLAGPNAGSGVSGPTTVAALNLPRSPAGDADDDPSLADRGNNQ